MPISRLGRILLCLPIIVGVAVASTFVAEGAFRVLGDRPSPEMKSLYTPFGDGAYKLLPHALTGANWASGSFTVTTDELGLRCDPQGLVACRPGDSIDALIVGDSQGFGNGVEFESTIPGRTALEAHQHGLRMANSSVGGHVARNQFELVQWLVEKQGLKVANYILLFTPSLTVSCDAYSRATVGDDGRLYDKPKTPREQALIYIKSNSMTYPRIRNAVRNLGIGNQASSSAQFIFHVYGADLVEQKVQENLESYLARFKDFATQHGARLWLVYVPLTVEVDFDSVAQSARAQGVALDREMPLRACTAAAAAAGLPFRSLRPVLERLGKEGKELHLKGDYHYSGAVSQACGDDLWQWFSSGLNSRDLQNESTHHPSLTVPEKI